MSILVIKSPGYEKHSLCSSVFVILLLIGGCGKERLCSDLPEGLYEGCFTNEGGNPVCIPLYLSMIDENTFIINSSGESSFGPFVKKEGCSIGGLIDGKSCLGEIIRKKGHFLLVGDYSYLGFSGGLGNPNPQYYQVNGKFEIKSN